MTNDETALLSDIEHELKPIINYLEFRYIDNELIAIGLNCSWKEFKLFFPEIKHKELVKLLDWFNDNKKAVQEVKQYLEVE